MRHMPLSKDCPRNLRYRLRPNQGRQKSGKTARGKRLSQGIFSCRHSLKVQLQIHFRPYRPAAKRRTVTCPLPYKFAPWPR